MRHMLRLTSTSQLLHMCPNCRSLHRSRWSCGLRLSRRCVGRLSGNSLWDRHSSGWMRSRVCSSTISICSRFFHRACVWLSTRHRARAHAGWRAGRSLGQQSAHTRARMSTWRSLRIHEYLKHTCTGRLSKRCSASLAGHGISPFHQAGVTRSQQRSIWTRSGPDITRWPYGREVRNQPIRKGSC
jgi:hypothetical protein